MLSMLWELILLDLKGKEKVKRDSRCVVTQRTLALLMQALIKAGGSGSANSPKGRPTAWAPLCRVWVSPLTVTQETRHVLNPHTWSTAQLPTAYHHCGYFEEGGTTLPFWLTLFLHPHCPHFQKERFMWGLTDFTVLIIFFFLP